MKTAMSSLALCCQWTVNEYSECSGKGRHEFKKQSARLYWLPGP